MRRLLVLLFCLFPCFCLSAPQSNTVEYTLKNGLKLIVREDHRAPVALFSVWYRVGGSYEHDGITGISHMLEHMMFRGTPTYGPGQLVKIVNNNGGNFNAMTADDFTMYYEVVSVDKLAVMFDLESDRMRHLTLAPALFKKEHQVVMEERRMRVDDSPQGITYERLNAAAHVNNPYHHPTIGWMTDIKHLTVDNLRQWYQTYYAPNNAVIVIVGDVKAEKMLALTQQYFGALKPEKIPVVKPRTEISQLGKRQVMVRVPAKLAWLMMSYNVPELTTAKQSWQPYALTLLAGILSEGDSSRLPSRLVRGQQLAVGAQASYSPYRLHNDLFSLTAAPTPQHSIKELKQALKQQIKLLQTSLVSAKELTRVKAQLIASNVYGKDSLMNQVMDLGSPEIIGLSWRDSDNFITHIKAVTARQIQQVAKQYLVSKRLTVAILKPLKESK